MGGGISRGELVSPGGIDQDAQGHERGGQVSKENEIQDVVSSDEVSKVSSPHQESSTGNPC